MSPSPTTGTVASPATLLRAAGLRVTPQRQLVLEVLAQAGSTHLTADDVFREVGDRYAGFNRSTVYRVLELLTAAGVVGQHRLGGSVSHFELIGDGVHRHLVCIRCRQIFDLEPGDLRLLGSRVRQRLGFAIGQVAVTVEGICSACRSDRPS